MLDAAEEATGFAVGRDRQDLEEDRQLVLALVQCVEIVGEAASRASSSTRRAHPAIAWADVIGMRNRLIHVYFDIDLDILWDTVTGDSPRLISELRRILPPEIKS